MLLALVLWTIAIIVGITAKGYDGQWVIAVLLCLAGFYFARRHFK